MLAADRGTVCWHNWSWHNWTCNYQLWVLYSTTSILLFRQHSVMVAVAYTITSVMQSSTSSPSPESTVSKSEHYITAKHRDFCAE